MTQHILIFLLNYPKNNVQPSPFMSIPRRVYVTEKYAELSYNTKRMTRIPTDHSH